MRTVLVTVAAVAAAACGDNPPARIDAASVVDDGAMRIDASPDAVLDITGTWIDKYVTLTGTSDVPSCNLAPAAVVIDQVTGAITTHPGACKADGTFRIVPTGPIGTYYIKLGTSWFETNKRTGLDLSSQHLGRADLGSVASASLAIDMTNMAPWTAADDLVAFAPNNGDVQLLDVAPAASATTVQATRPWTGTKVDAAKGDTLQILQLGAHQTGSGLPYQTLDRAFTASAVTMTNNTTSTVSGAFTTATTKSQQIRVNAASFNAFATAVNPNVTTRTLDGSLYASPTTDTARSPSMFSFTASGAGVASMNFGTMSIVDPYPAAWQRLVRIQEAYVVPYMLNGVNGAINAIASRILPASVADTTIIDAILGPPTSPKLDTVSAFTATHISPVVKVSWSAPSLGTPTDYEVQVYDVTIDGTSLKFTSVIKLTTKQTAIRIPAGTLLGARQYVFSIRSRIRQNVDIYDHPLRAGDTSSSAEVLTALVTTDV
jgi:hypothetical protein